MGLSDAKILNLKFQSLVDQIVGTNLCALLNSLGTPFEIIDIKSKQFPEVFKYGDVRDLDSLNDAVSGRVVVCAAIHRDDIKLK